MFASNIIHLHPMMELVGNVLNFLIVLKTLTDRMGPAKTRGKRGIFCVARRDLVQN
jgi:hypothetical protein